ncbi:MAG: restriction endonuclease [Acidobacteriota bacterium]
MASKKPPLTGSKHPLPFGALGPEQFERLCLWLVRREKFERVEHLGEAGSEGGRDVVGWKAERRWVFQCKRVRVFSLSHAKKEITKLRALPRDQQPDNLVFVVSRAVSAETREAIRTLWGDEATCHFWSGNELDERVKCHPALVAEFFELPPDTSRLGRLISLPYASLGELFQGREEVLASLHQKLTDGKSGKATAIAGKAVHGLGGVGKTRLAIPLPGGRNPSPKDFLDSTGFEHR